VSLPPDHPRHAELMRVALRRAMRAVGRTRPNPCVGAVVARDGVILSVGHHVKAGTAHGEAVALQRAGDAARGADLYVTLEPCAHHGRMPPCVDAVLRSGVARVFMATRDVNPRVDGRGVLQLQAAGVHVHEGLLEAEARALLAPFMTWMRTGKPLVILKAAVSLDGRIAPSSRHSAGLSGPRAQAWLHRLRDRVDAILVGVETLLTDDPRLTPRRVPVGAKGPHGLHRVVLDTALRTPLHATVLQDLARHPVWIFCGPDADTARQTALEARGARVVRVTRHTGGLSWDEVLAALGATGLTSLLVEGGSRVHGSLLAAQAAHQASVVVTPRFLGNQGVPLAVWDGAAEVAGAPVLDPVKIRRLGADALMEGPLRYLRKEW